MKQRHAVRSFAVVTAMVLMTVLVSMIAGETKSSAATTNSSARARLLERIRTNRPSGDLANMVSGGSPLLGLEKRASSWSSLGQDIVGPVSAMVRSRGRSIFVRGTDNQVHHRYAQGESDWGAWENVGGSITSPVGVDPLFDRENLDVVARGTDGKVWHRAYGFGDPWEKIGDLSIQGAPVVRHYASGDAVIFARGSDNAVWAIDQVDFTWQSWVSLGGSTTSDLAIAWSGGVAGLFARGSANQLMYYPLFADNPSWTSLGQTLASAPSVSVPNDTRMDVAVRSSDNTIRYRSFSGGVWNGWLSVGGATDDTPIVDFKFITTLIVNFLVHGSDGHIRERQYHPDTAAFSPWADLGSGIASSPTPLKFQLDTGPAYEIFARGSDGSVRRTWD